MDEMREASILLGLYLGHDSLNNPLALNASKSKVIYF